MWHIAPLGGAREVGSLVVLWVATALLYPRVRDGVAWFVDTVVLDLGGLSYCDCTGLNVFANAQRDAELLGKSIVLTRPRGLLRRVFDSVQFSRVVRIADDADQFDDREGSRGADAAEP